MMKRWKLGRWIAGAATAGLLGGAAQAQDWYASAEVLGWHRDQPAGQLLAVDFNTPPIAPPLRTDEGEFNFAMGQRIRLGKLTSPESSCEFVYTGVNEWNASGAVTSDSGALFAFGPALVNTQFDQIRFEYNSTMHGLELNRQNALLNADAWSGSVLWGARYLYLGEEFVVTGDPIQAEETILRTNNHLFGPQLGAEFVWSAEESLRARFGGKGAALLNIAGEKTGNTLEPLLSSEGTDVQFGTLLELYAGLEKSVGFGTFKVGYQIFYVSGVALAPDQLANYAPFQTAGLPASNDVHSQGSIFAHGVSAGFEHRW